VLKATTRLALGEPEVPTAPGGRGTAKVAIVGAGRVGTTLAREHGDSEVPLWSSATIGGVPLSQWKNAGLLPLDTTARADIFRRVVGGGGQVIAGKGFTNYAISLATARSSSRCSTTSTRCCRSAR
jgi:malate/lactate dehydrogenase